LRSIASGGRAKIKRSTTTTPSGSARVARSALRASPPIAIRRCRRRLAGLADSSSSSKLVELVPLVRPCERLGRVEKTNPGGGCLWKGAAAGITHRETVR
jgi:hypothetical protein